MTVLLPDLRLEADPGGASVVAGGVDGVRHAVPGPLVERVRAALAAGAPPDEPTAAWLEARHLLRSPRVERVEAWAAARTPAEPARAGPLVIPPGSRFTCHGCGRCCESYTVAPITEEERRAIVTRAADLAPHVAAPPTAWFVPLGPPAGETGGSVYRLGRQPSGACVFLDADRRCTVHTRLGEGCKPHVCRRFPLLVTRRPDSTIVTLRAECGTLARSRDDGLPLERQLDWVRRTAAEEREPLVVPRLLRMAEDCFVPYRLVRVLERRAVGLVRGAPTLEQAHLAIRDVVLGTHRALGPRPDDADLDRAEALASTGSLAALRAGRQAADPRVALQHLAGLLDVLLQVIPQFVELDEADADHGAVARANDRFVLDVVERLWAALAAQLGWPAHPAVPAEAMVEGIEAHAVDPGSHDPLVVDFVRECTVHRLGSSRPALAAPGLVYGFGLLALGHLFARFGARLLALRRGAPAAGREDWNQALAVLDRALVLIELAGAAPAVEPIYANLFAHERLPS